ncbi:hypothetical protein QBC39DRAFT_389056 [Podospora conica]|nr:hypothetical protein QBC39DRAFT_389056 [Schizothecium conicum]
MYYYSLTVNLEGLLVAVTYPRSIDSSLEGNFSAPFKGISINFTYIDKIIRFNKEDINIILAKIGSGLFFPIDLRPSIKVINLIIVFADGTIIKIRRCPRKSSTGYNLNNLFIGSERMLGLVTEATLKLSVIPEEFSVAVTGIPIKVVNIGGATAPIIKVNKGGNFKFTKDEREDEVYKLAGIIEVSKKEINELRLFTSILGYIRDRNFYEKKVEIYVKNIVKRALEIKGIYTSEYSIG